MALIDPRCRLQNVLRFRWSQNHPSINLFVNIKLYKYMVYLYLVKVSGIWILWFSLKRGLKFSLVQNHMAAIDSEVYCIYTSAVLCLSIFLQWRLFVFQNVLWENTDMFMPVIALNVYSENIFWYKGHVMRNSKW